MTRHASNVYNVEIRSEGTGTTTEVLVGGKPIKGVRSVTWSVSVDHNTAVAVLEVLLPRAAIKCDMGEVRYVPILPDETVAA